LFSLAQRRAPAINRGDHSQLGYQVEKHVDFLVVMILGKKYLQQGDFGLSFACTIYHDRIRRTQRPFPHAKELGIPNTAKSNLKHQIK
jgi:hypothetical protein